jgi:hypothetical protein
MNTARLLTPATNYAVVQLPGRNFPGVVIQGDSLNNLVSLLDEALLDEDERMDLIAEALDILKGARHRYETTCSEAGIQLPYSINARPRT